jgi:hypothetical protein
MSYKDPEKRRAYLEASRDERLKKKREFYQANIERLRKERREAARQERAEDPEKVRERKRKWNRANRDKIRDYARKEREVDPERVRARGRKANHKYRATNLEKVRARSREIMAKRYHANVEKFRKLKRDAARKERMENPEKVRARQRANNLRASYGMTVEDFETLRALQNERCAICRDPLSDNPKRVHVDHCHETGRVRGILCHHCNTGVGLFRDDPERLHRAIEYLAEPGWLEILAAMKKPVDG